MHDDYHHKGKEYDQYREIYDEKCNRHRKTKSSYIDYLFFSKKQEKRSLVRLLFSFMHLHVPLYGVYGLDVLLRCLRVLTRRSSLVFYFLHLFLALSRVFFSYA